MGFLFREQIDFLLFLLTFYPIVFLGISSRKMILLIPVSSFFCLQGAFYNLFRCDRQQKEAIAGPMMVALSEMATPAG
jgi:hypothetical protein